MGPHRDITGVLEKAIKRRGLKFITTFHHGFAWPEDGKLRIKSLASDAGKVTSVNLLGHTGALVWTQGGQGLEITLPNARPCEHAFALKIRGDALKPLPMRNRE